MHPESRLSLTIVLQSGRFRLRTALGIALGLACAAPAAGQRRDDWSLSRPEAAAPPPRAQSRAPEGRELGLALRALERRPVIEQLLATYRARDGGSDGLLREVEARAASAREPRRWILLLAQLQRVRGDPAAARASFERALALGPDPATLLLCAEFEREQDEPARARELLQQALGLPAAAARKLEIASELLELCLRVGDRGCARSQFEWLAREPNGFERALAYPRALADLREYAEASAAYESLLARSGKERARCAVRLELGKLRLAQAALPQAREQLQLARAPGCHEAVLEPLLEVHRGLGSLPAFARELAASSDATAQRLAGRAFEELGQPTAAAEAYRRAFAKQPDDAVLAERLIELAKRGGRVAEVIAVHERMLQRPEPDPRWLRELTEWLRAQGESEQALAVAARTGRAQPRSVPLHQMLVELYTAWELPERAHAELEWLTRIDPDPASHVLALAEAELAQGREQQAVNVLRRLRNGAPTRLAGHLRVGQAYADHDLPREALLEYEAALLLSPESLAAMRGRALALAHVYRYRDAEAEWQRLLAHPAANAEQRRDAREQLVELWAELGELEKHVRDYEEAFGYSAKQGPRFSGDGAPAPEPEAGRLLAESYLRLARQPSYRAQPARYLRAAEDVLGQVVRLDPTDVSSWRALERLRARRGDREGSIAALEQLVQLEPEHAADHWMRIAEYAQAAFKQDAAIEYAERAALAAPQDPALQEWLGDAYRARRDDAGARQHYARALELDPTRLAVALRLADLYVQHGDPRAAQQLLLAVLRSAVDPALVLRAGRAALQLAKTKQARVDLERRLLSLQWNEPRAERRRLLIELYETLVPELMATSDLAALRARAEPALLDALSDADPDQIERAVRLLRWVGSPSSALPLLALAESDADVSIRRRALAAVCALGGPELAARELALGLAREVELRDMATFCLARTPVPAMAPALRKLSASETPAVRALAMIGLGLLGARDQPGSADSLRLTLAHDVSALVRVAAAIALGLLSRAEAPAARDLQLGREALVLTLRGPDAAIAESAALSLGLLGDRAAAGALADSLFDARANVAMAAELGLRSLECSAPRGLPLAEPEPGFSFEPLLTAAHTALAPCAQAPLAPRFAEIAEAVRRALAGPPALRSRALTWLGRESAVDAGWQIELLSSIAADLAPLASDRDFRLRRDVARLLGVTPVTTAETTLFVLVGDPVLEVRGAALDALAQRKLPDRPEYSERLAKVAASDEAFGMRRRAVQALAGMTGVSATRALVRVLSNDPFALVRESAARALSGREPDLVAAALLAAVRRDAEPRVRVAAARALRQVGGALLHTAQADPQLPEGIREILVGP
jgi:tetratricopeptide (TPR) repeat protein